MKNLLLFLSLFFTSASAFAESACEQALQEGDAAKAITAAKKDIQASKAPAGDSLKDELDMLAPWFCLAEAQESLEQHDEALATLQSATDLASLPEARMLAFAFQGQVLLSAGKAAEAVALLRQSLNIATAAAEKSSPTFERGNRTLLGIALQQNGDHAAALEQFQLGLKLAANDNERAESYGRIADAQSRLGRHEEAIAQQLKAVMMEEKAGSFGDYAAALLELGRICLDGKQYADAEKWLNKLLKQLEGTGDSMIQSRAHAFLSQVKAAQGDNAAAEEHKRLADEMESRISRETRVRQEKSAQ
ncbi:MAG: tetratricopeptide repeat protein [Methylobacillus sp.]|nr:tetratricopeptide repeat protein [Methylobacillus sp.]